MVEVIYEKNHSSPDAFGHPPITEWQKYQETSLNNGLSTHANLEKSLKEILAEIQDPQLKLGLEILLFLISHPKKDVRAFSLGQLYPLLGEDRLHRLIIEDLREMCKDSQLEVHEAAEKSLECISDNIYNLMICEMILEILVEIEKDTKIGIKYFRSALISSHPQQQSSPPNSKNRFKKAFIKCFRQLNVLLDKILFSDQLEDLFPELEEVEDFCIGDILDEGIIPYIEIYNFQWRPLDSIERLATIYAHTFTEKGHLKHLKRYLDDENYHIRRVGVNALVTVVKFLLNGSNQKSTSNLNYNSSPYFQINPHTSVKL